MKENTLRGKLTSLAQKKLKPSLNGLWIFHTFLEQKKKNYDNKGKTKNVNVAMLSC